MDGYLVEFIVENILSELASFNTGYVGALGIFGGQDSVGI
mgnify:CR=1 FL=1